MVVDVASAGYLATIESSMGQSAYLYIPFLEAESILKTEDFDTAGVMLMTLSKDRGCLRTL